MLWLILLRSIAVEKHTIAMMIELSNVISKFIRSMYILLYTLVVACPWPNCGGKAFINCNDARIFVFPIDYRSRNWHRNLWGRQCVFLRMTSELDIYTMHWYNVDSEVWLVGCATLIYLYWKKFNWWGQIGLCGLPFPGTGCLVQDVIHSYLIWNA